MSRAIVRITEKPHTVIIYTGSKEPGLGKMATTSNDPLRSLDVRLHYSPLPGADDWEIDIPGLLPVMHGTWIYEDDTVYLRGPGTVPFLELRPYPGAGVFGDGWQMWPSLPFRKGLYGEGNRSGPPNAGTLSQVFSWTCTFVS
jgi:hypothetical protein